MEKCIICGKNKFRTVWNDKIRNSAKSFTKKKEKIFQCYNCDLVFLKKKKRILENSSLTRKIFNKDNSIIEFLKFHTPREKAKLNFIKKIIPLKNKKILESNCGAGILIRNLKKQSKLTAGLDNNFYRNHIEKEGHKFFSNLKEIQKSKIKFDVIFSLSEIEHKYDPINFIKDLKKILTKKGVIILRIPNYDNIYAKLLGKSFFKYDFRISHNFYFSEKNLDLLFKKLNLKIIKKDGFNEYSFNHLLNYIFHKKRFGKKRIMKFFKESDEIFVKKNIENSLSSTSLIYLLK